MKISVYRILALCFILGLFTSVTAQNGSSSLKRNGAYAELYLLRHDFSDGFISLNYERIIGKKMKNYVRAGIYPDFESTVSIPFTWTRVTGPERVHHLEYGLGGVFRIEFYEGEVYRDLPAIMIPVMYRYQKESGFFFRGGMNLFLSWPILPSPSVSAGFRF